MRFCEKCGKQIKDEAVFCPFCGAMVDSSSTSATVTVSDEMSRTQSRQEKKEKKTGKKFSGILGFVLCILLVLLFFWLYGIINGTDGSDEPVRYAPNQIPQEQAR